MADIYIEMCAECPIEQVVNDDKCILQRSKQYKHICLKQFLDFMLQK